MLKPQKFGIGQVVRLTENVELGWDRQYGEVESYEDHGRYLVRVKPAYRLDRRDDGLRDVNEGDMEPSDVHDPPAGLKFYGWRKQDEEA